MTNFNITDLTHGKYGQNHGSIEITLPPFSGNPLPFTEKEIMDTPEVKGVYFIYGEDGDLLYIGMSANIRNRLLQHFRGNHSATRSNTGEYKHLFKSFNYITVCTMIECDIYETYAINKLKPKLNMKKTWTYTSERRKIEDQKKDEMYWENRYKEAMKGFAI